MLVLNFAVSSMNLKGTFGAMCVWGEHTHTEEDAQTSVR